jgi:hypothetical protein
MLTLINKSLRPFSPTFPARLEALFTLESLFARLEALPARLEALYARLDTYPARLLTLSALPPAPIKVLPDTPQRPFPTP